MAGLLWLMLTGCVDDKHFPDEESGIECGDFFNVFPDEDPEVTGTPLWISSTDPSTSEDGFTGELTSVDGKIEGEVYFGVYSELGVFVSGEGTFMGFTVGDYMFEETGISYFCEDGLHVGSWVVPFRDDAILIGQFRLAEEGESWHHMGETAGLTVNQQVMDFTLLEGTPDAESTAEELLEVHTVVATGTFNRRW